MPARHVSRSTRAFAPADEASVIRLVGAVLNDAHDEWQVSDRRYLSKSFMAKLNPARDTGAVSAIGAGD